MISTDTFSATRVITHVNFNYLNKIEACWALNETMGDVQRLQATFHALLPAFYKGQTTRYFTFFKNTCSWSSVNGWVIKQDLQMRVIINAEGTNFTRGFFLAKPLVAPRIQITSKIEFEIVVCDKLFFQWRYLWRVLNINRKKKKHAVKNTKKIWDDDMG